MILLTFSYTGFGHVTTLSPLETRLVPDCCAVPRLVHGLRNITDEPATFPTSCRLVIREQSILSDVEGLLGRDGKGRPGHSCYV